MARIGADLAALLVLAVLVAFSSRAPLFGALAIGIGCFLLALLSLGAERAGFIMILIAMFTAPQNDLRPVEALEFVTVSDLSFIAGFLLLTPTFARRRLRIPPLFFVGALVLTYGVLVASLLSQEPVLALNYGSRLISAAVLLPLAFLWWRPSIRSIDALAWAYVLGQCVSTAYALIPGGAAGNRALGLSTHANFFGIGGLLAIMLLVHLWHRTAPNRRWLVIGAACVCTYSITISGSRAALIVLLVLAVLYPAIERSVISAYVLIAGALAAVLTLDRLLSAAGEGSAVARLLAGDATTTGSDLARQNALRIGLESFLNEPLFGKGFGRDSLLAHNIYLEVAVGVGIFGLVGFLMLGAALVLPMFGTSRLRHLGYAALAYAGVGMLTNSLWDRFVWPTLCLALLANLRYDDEPRTEASESPPELKTAEAS